MDNILFQLIKSLRPKQWIKNLAVFAPITFTGQLFNPLFFNLSFKTFVVFCLLSSGSYLVNDTLDAPKDRLHPFKKNRPIAKGTLPPSLALIAASLLIFFGFFFSLTISLPLFIGCLAFILIHIIYSLLLKHKPVVDILAIASCYILRVYAGEFATGFHLSIWLSLCVISLSLFLAIGKRRGELTLMQSFSKNTLIKTRSTLTSYSKRLLDIYTSMFANSTWLTYALYTFLEKPPRPSIKRYYLLEYISPAYSQRKWLMITIPLVIFGLMRYLQLIYEKQQGESPEKVLLSDKPLLATVIIWGLSVVFIIYYL